MSRLRDLIAKNIKEIPFEGTEINVDGIEILIKGLLKGMIPYSKQFEQTPKGYKFENKWYSREEIVNKFLYEKL